MILLMRSTVLESKTSETTQCVLYFKGFSKDFWAGAFGVFALSGARHDSRNVTGRSWIVIRVYSNHT